MLYDRELIVHKLARWENFISNYSLPAWDAIPDFGLYMEQVVTFLSDSLSFVPVPEEPKDRLITAAAINNYVRLKLMPAPVKKRYYRIHIAYLIMIFTLKQSLSIQDVQRSWGQRAARPERRGPECGERRCCCHSGPFRLRQDHPAALPELSGDR